MKNIMKKIVSLLFLSAIVALGSCDDDSDNNKAVVSDGIKAFITQNYPGAVIKDAEYEKNGYFEVEIRHDGHIKDVYFGADDKWVATKWDLSLVDVPEAVKAAVTSQYPDYRIDDVDYVVTTEREAYKVEIERGNYEKLLYISPDGTILTE